LFLRQRRKGAGENLRSVQRKTITRAALEHLVRDCQAFLAAAARFVMTAELLERGRHPASGFGVIGPHVEVAQVARPEIGRHLHHLALSANDLLRMVENTLLEAETRGDLDVGALRRERSGRPSQQRLQ